MAHNGLKMGSILHWLNRTIKDFLIVANILLEAYNILVVTNNIASN